MAEFRMPSLGADMEAGTLVEWKVAPGDAVHKGQIVAVVETQKGAIDVEIFEDGVVESLLVPAGTEVPVGTVLAIVRGAAVPTADRPAQPTRRISPRARKRAQELGVDVARLRGSGPDGAITSEDVEAAAPDIAPAAASPTAALSTATAPVTAPSGGMRNAIAAAMSRSKREIPHYYLWHTIDLEPALQWMETENARRPVAERLLPIALFVRAVALALREFPELCGFWKDDRLVPSPGIHVGLAVSLRDGGLVDPALHDADRATLGDLMSSIRDVTARARTGGLRASELSDSAITITNLGDQGTHGVLAVIHPPQTAIVGFGAVSRRPWVAGDAVVARRLVDVSLAADHRVSDGHRGARFLRAVERALGKPEAL